MKRFFVNNKYFLISLLITLVAFLLRIYDLDLRTMHHDETVNHYFLKKTSELGYYPYSHQNYHGPLYFYLTWIFFHYLGDSEAYLRLSNVIIGTGAVLLPLMLQKILGWKWTYLAQLFIATSSTIIYYNRYAIHESSFLFFTLVLAFSFYRYLKLEQKIDLIWCGIGLGALISIKETYIISGLALLIAGIYVYLINRKFPNLSQIFRSLAISLLVIIVFYTGFLQWSKGLSELALSVPQWMTRNDSDTGHFKAFGYYLSIFWGSNLLDLFSIPYWEKVKLPLELPTLLTLIFTPILIPAVLKDPKKTDFISFCLIWTIIVVFIYSIPVRYKTPWLIINLTYPAYLLLAGQFAYLLHRSKYLFQKILILCLICASLGLNLYSTWYYNWKFPSQNQNPLSYVHTNPEILELTKAIHISTKNNPQSRILMGLENSWPFPYYLRKVSGQITYDSNYGELSQCEKLPRKFALIILDHTKTFDCPNWKKTYFRTADHQEANLFQPIK